MKKELQDELFKKYPKIFRQKDLSKQETAMCWGISCGDGWYDLINELCCTIQNRVNNVNRQKRYKLEHSTDEVTPEDKEDLVCEAVQVKEKFGGLRFYIYGGDDYIDGAIHLAESLSHQTCSECGCKRDSQESDRGWIYSMCLSCQDEHLSRRKNEQI